MLEDKKKAIGDLNRKKFGTEGQREKEKAPIKEHIEIIQARVVMLYQIKDYKIPYYEKLPKDNQFYKHLMQNLNYTRMRDAATSKANEDKNMFNNASLKMKEEKDLAETFGSP